MDQTVHAIMAPYFLVIGVSHVVQPRLWAEFFRVLRQTGVAPFIIAMYTLPVGLFLVVGHNKWVWDWPLFLTVAGWGQTFKGTLYFVFPRIAERVLERAERRPYRQYRIAGAPFALLGAILTWQAVMARVSS